MRHQTGIWAASPRLDSFSYNPLFVHDTAASFLGSLRPWAVLFTEVLERASYARFWSAISHVEVVSVKRSTGDRFPDVKPRRSGGRVRMHDIRVATAVIYVPPGRRSDDDIVSTRRQPSNAGWMGGI